MVYLCKEYYSAIRKNEILPFATTWMDLEGIMLSRITQRKTNAMWLHPYVKFNKTNEQGEQRERRKPRNTFLTLQKKVIVTRG